MSLFTEVRDRLKRLGQEAEQAVGIGNQGHGTIINSVQNYVAPHANRVNLVDIAREVPGTIGSGAKAMASGVGNSVMNLMGVQHANAPSIQNSLNPQNVATRPDLQQKIALQKRENATTLARQAVAAVQLASPLKGGFLTRGAVGFATGAGGNVAEQKITNQNAPIDWKQAGTAGLGNAAFASLAPEVGKLFIKGANATANSIKAGAIVDPVTGRVSHAGFAKLPSGDTPVNHASDSFTPFDTPQERLTSSLQELDASQAGSRVTATHPITGEKTNISNSSTFPDWVPERLRSKDLINKVTNAYDENLNPTILSGRAGELQQVLHDHADVPLPVKPAEVKAVATKSGTKPPVTPENPLQATAGVNKQLKLGTDFPTPTTKVPITAKPNVNGEIPVIQTDAANKIVTAPKPIDPNLVFHAQGIGDGTVPIQTSTGSGIINEVKGAFGTGAGTTDVQNALRNNRGMYDLNKDTLIRQSQPLVKQWDKLIPEDHVKFIQDVQTGTPQATPELQQLASQYRDRFNQDYKLAQSIKPDLPYMDNYFAQSGVWANPTDAKAFANKWATGSLGGKPGALEQRTFPTIQDGIQAGLKLKETNPETIALNSRVQLLKAKMAQDFKNTQLAKGVPEEKINAVLDKYLSQGLNGAVYKTVQQANFAMNSLQLGLSAFHFTGTAINASASKAAIAVNDLLTGHPLTALKNAALTPTASLEYMFKGNQILKDVKAGNLTTDVANIAGGGGKFKTPDIYHGVGFQDALTNMQKADWGSKLKGTMQLIPATLRTASVPLMEQWVPRLKAGAAADLISSNLAKLPKGATEEMINKVRADAINSIDNRFGQLNMDNVFWNKTIKDLLSLGTRSPGWNIGTFRELGGGVKDLGGMKQLLSGGGISNRAAYTVTLPVLVGMLGATYQYMKTGQAPQEIKDYFYPKTGQIDPKTGNPERVAFPTYAKDVYSFFTNPIQTLKNKTSPALSMTSQIMNNQDYYGNQIADPYANKLTQAGQIAKYAGTAALPFSITGGSKRVDPNLQSRAENFMGIVKAPGDITNPGQSDYYNATAELQQLQTQYSSTAKKVASGDLTQAQGTQKLNDIQTRMDNAKAVINKGLPSVAGSTRPQNNSGNSSIVSLPGGKFGFVDSSNILHKNLTQSSAQLMQEKQDFSSSGKSYGISSDGSTVFRRSADGTPTDTPKIKYDASLYEAKKTSLKNSGDVKGWLDNANQLYQNYQTQLQDPSLDDVEKIALQNKIDSLTKEAGKYTSYGAFTKPKKAKVAAKATKAKKYSIKSVKNITIKAPTKRIGSTKLPDYTRSATPKYSMAKPKKITSKKYTLAKVAKIKMKA